jgi:hypothetical protein
MLAVAIITSLLLALVFIILIINLERCSPIPLD